MQVGAGEGAGDEAEAVSVSEGFDVGAPYRVGGVVAADDEGGEEDVGFVDEILVEEGGEEFGAAFEEEIGVIAVGEVAEEVGELGSALFVCGEREGHGAFAGEGEEAALGGAVKRFGVGDQERGFGDGAD